MGPKRILVISNTIDAGGAETFVMKVFRAMDKSKFVFDFLINKKESNFYLEEIKTLGGKVFYGESKSRNPIKCFSIIKKTVKDGGYKTVLCIAVHPIGFIDMLAAKMGGAKRLLSRSTNSHAGGVISPVLATVSRPFMRRLSTAMFSPSREAAVWLYGRNAVNSGKVILLNNGVDTSKFVYNEEVRHAMRAQLGISDDTLVVGHIGRFNRQKNHEKLLSVFNEIKNQQPNAVLFLVGDGEGKSKVEEMANEKRISESVRFLGIRKDVPALLSAIDVMVFPSLFEGMPNTIIEAQSCDLPCVISDTIDRGAKITDNIIFLSLEDNDIMWSSKAIESVKKDRKNVSQQIEDAGYSIQTTTQLLADLF